MPRRLTSKEEERMKELTGKPYPPQIIKLNERIKLEEGATNLSAAATGIIDEASVNKIVKMKIRRSKLYEAWIMGINLDKVE